MRYLIALTLLLTSCGSINFTESSSFCTGVGEIGFDSVKNREAGLPLHDALKVARDRTKTKQGWFMAATIGGYMEGMDAHDWRDYLVRKCYEEMTDG